MNELKPCPFCGNDDVHSAKTWVLGSVWRYFVKCTKCSAAIERSTSRKAVEAWNRRVGGVSGDESGFTMFND